MLQQSLQIQTQNPREEDFFRAMLQYFVTQYPMATWIYETHKHIVEFNCVNSTNQNTFQNVRKEISDLLIISFSPQRQLVKATFLQAKLKKTGFNRPLNFRGDVFQYFLLSQRPQIVDNNAMSYPYDILSTALYDSICSYGIFYKNNNLFDFSYSTACDINIISQRPITRNAYTRTLQFKNCQDVTLKHNMDIEARTIYGANVFEASLIRMEIGSPIFPPTIQAILSPYNQNRVIQELFETFNIDMDDIQEQYLKVHKNIMVINVDE